MYVKIFSKILDSSIWMEPASTKVVWLTLLAAMDQDGFAQFASVKSLAHRAVVSLEECERAVETLSESDPESSNPEHDGKRIEKVPGGWIILNASHYRKIKDREMQREMTKERTRKWRERKKSDAKTSPSVTDRHPASSSASAYASSLKGGVGGKKTLAVAELIKELQSDPAYKDLNVELEYHKCGNWCKRNHKVLSEKRFVNWLNRADRPLPNSNHRIHNSKDPEIWDSLSPDEKSRLIKETK